MEATAPSLRAFAYRAQTGPGDAVTGTIDAPDGDEAQKRLAAMGLRVIELAPADAEPRGRPLRGEDFIAFNQQLAQLTAAGLPVESGLRLIAQDMRSGRLAASVRAVADELEKGAPLGEAFDKHRGRFPSLYGRLIDAGVRSNNLPGMLLGLGRHLELAHRLRATFWQAVAYPAVVLVTIAALLVFLSAWVVPGYRAVVDDFGTELPGLTRLLFAVSMVVPWLIAGAAAVVAAALAGWRLARWVAPRSVWLDRMAVATPLLGPVLRANVLARWCDTLRLAVQTGLPLPQAIELAGESSGWGSILSDGRKLTQDLESGRRLDAARQMAVVPATVPLTIELASDRQDLPAMLHHLSQMYQQQAELRLSTLRMVLTPALLIFVAAVIGLVILAMLLPLVALVMNLTGGGW